MAEKRGIFKIATNKEKKKNGRLLRIYGFHLSLFQTSGFVYSPFRLTFWFYFISFEFIYGFARLFFIRYFLFYLLNFFFFHQFKVSSFDQLN